MDVGLVGLQDAACARAADEAAVAAGETWLGLMRLASGHLARGVVRALSGAVYGRRVLVLAGPGNNGGDGWGCAPRLRDRGAQVVVCAPAGLDREMSDEAERLRTEWRSCGGRVAGTDDGDDEETAAQTIEELVEWADVVVDALLGTGSSPPLRGPVGEAVRTVRLAHALRAEPRPGRAHSAAAAVRRPLIVVSADLPSGLDADTGQVDEDAIRADLTVTFGGRKVGLVLAPGREHVGRLVVGDLGPHHVAPPTSWELLTDAAAARPPLAPDADKRARGRVLVVAGSSDAAGAAVLATTGALETGAGLVTAVVPDVVRDRVAAARPGAMTRALPSDDAGELSIDAATAVLVASGLAPDAGVASIEPADLDVDAVVVGPGCGYGDGTAAVVRALLRLPVVRVLDADALNAFRGRADELRSDVGVTVLTPHERELARLAGAEVPAGPHARAELATRVAADLGVVVVAKGPSTVVVSPGGRRVVVPGGGPELGVGGTGDLLAGMLAAHLAEARPVEPLDAVLPAARAVHAHARAGERAATAHGSRPAVAAIAAALGDA